MNRLLVLLCMASLALGGGFLAFGGDSGKTPLDLPAGGRIAVDDEEVVALDVITLFGQEYSGSAFYFAFSTDAWMNNACALEILCAELQGAIRSLSGGVKFNLIGYSGAGNALWSTRARLASTVSKDGACAWLDELVATGVAAIEPGALALIENCQLLAAEHRQMIFVARTWTGPGPQVIEAITSANSQATPIHTVYMGTMVGVGQWLQELAEANHGTYVNVPLPMGGGD